MVGLILRRIVVPILTVTAGLTVYVTTRAVTEAERLRRQGKIRNDSMWE